jgi:mannose-6-phosphate isomerase
MQGQCRIRLRQTGKEVTLKAGHTCLIPAAIADYDIIPNENAGLCRILDAFIDKKDRSLLSQVSRFFHLTKK